jgi:cysteine desulfurase / selenocysteine lyase
VTDDTLDVAALRAQTPGAEHVTHLNNAGSSLMPTPVIDAIHGYLEHEIMGGGYETHDAFADEIEGVYRSIGTLINADPGEIAIADCATRAWDVAFYGIPLGPGDRILTTTTEYVSNWAAYLHVRDTIGVVVDIVPDTPGGDIDVDALEAMIDDSVKLITINHIPTHSAVVNPAAAVGIVARAHGIPYLLDACQSVGHVPIDVQAIGCDMLSTTSRKFLRGPRGEGFLFVRSDFLDRLPPVFVELHNATVVLPDRYELKPNARRYETWEKSFATVMGMGAAVDYALELGIDRIWTRIRYLAATARERLSDVPGVTVRDKGTVKGGIVSFTVDGRSPLEIRELLAERRINVSTATRLSAPIDMHQRDIDDLVRASFHAYNIVDEIDELTDALRAMVGIS